MGIKNRIKKAAKALLIAEKPVADTYVDKIPENLSSSEYWTRHNVTMHYQFKDREDSLAFLRWRGSQYLFYEDLMPCSGFDDKVVLDYGCGPGHDVVGFLEHSKPGKVIAMDVSSTSMEETRKRVVLHDKGEKNVEFILIGEKKGIPLADNSVDYIHSSGVLHHAPNLPEILNDFYRILKPGGMIRIMVYNYNSIWVHYYVPYHLQIIAGTSVGLSLAEAFKRSTDGPSCPISNYYTPAQFLKICARSKLKGKYLGAAISILEMGLLPKRFDAIRNMQVAEEHRDFLKRLTFDQYQRPVYEGEVAGIDAVFELTK